MKRRRLVVTMVPIITEFLFKEKTLTDTSKFVMTCWCLWDGFLFAVISQRDAFRISLYSYDIGAMIGELSSAN